MKNDGGPAFPHSRLCENENGGNITIITNGGMSLRDYFAGKALAAVIQRYAGDTLEPGETRAGSFARKAYEMADAMLVARDKE